ncbi:phosphoribosyltransferase [Novosphingobium nitrogenifigens DSM 19370]|uniref:Phosphoribosyltransferase n=1 Tax=Novosphingobium nitrogenifigens DSM 19370 TaxID=983920 RepID=F1Z8Q4_9SPHN|nr:phosphoribosyltransferase family protein [Novosphingobium nitrogenifigens]EGD58971.1 phosphoribosyltransferase [Novosphingobium nitrogenifigens DSM 19370]
MGNAENTVEKTWLTADRLLEDSFRLGNLIVDSGFVPTHIVGIWRGGAPVGIAVQELLEYRGIDTDHIAIRTKSYEGIDRQKSEVRVYSLGYLIDTLEPSDRLVVVDDVFDSGRSVEAFLQELQARCRHNTPREIRVATVYWKPRRNKTELRPDYYVHETDEWLVFPHEICGLSEEEIRAHKPQAGLILKD